MCSGGRIASASASSKQGIRADDWREPRLIELCWAFGIILWQPLHSTMQNWGAQEIPRQGPSRSTRTAFDLLQTASA
jgi:hypothetical protein